MFIRSLRNYLICLKTSHNQACHLEWNPSSVNSWANKTGRRLTFSWKVHRPLSRFTTTALTVTAHQARAVARGLSFCTPSWWQGCWASPTRPCWRQPSCSSRPSRRPYRAVAGWTQGTPWGRLRPTPRSWSGWWPSLRKKAQRGRRSRYRGCRLRFPQSSCSLRSIGDAESHWSPHACCEDWRSGPSRDQSWTTTASGTWAGARWTSIGHPLKLWERWKLTCEPRTITRSLQWHFFRVPSGSTSVIPI